MSDFLSGIAESLRYMGSLSVSMLEGVKYTVGLFFITLIFSIPLGLLLTLLRNSGRKVLRGITGFYVWIMRGTPLLLQLFFFYFGLPNLPVIGDYLVLGRFEAACLTFVLNYAAYFCEIFGGGILSVWPGQ